MIRLRTIGPVSVRIGEKPVPARNGLIIASLLYLVAERGKAISRKVFSDLFFPNSDADAAHHSGRQLVYRLRKEKGVAVDGDQVSIVFSDVVEWDVEQVMARGTVSDEELEALHGGYLTHFAPEHSDAFSRWLDEHRSTVTRKLRELLVGQIQAARSKRDYRTAGRIARACLGLDPLNEAATMAAAESLAATGAKTDALHLLDRYVEDVGPRSDLRIAPRLLRERIADYVVEPDRDQTALIGRAEELEILRGILDESAAGRPQICVISGQAGIGKTRLVEEACSIAALTGHAIAHVRLTSSDVDRPFAILRDLGPTLIDLPGALGAAPEALAAVRGLCGRGPTQHARRPDNAYDSRAVAADIQQKVVDLACAVSEEQPLVIHLENADYLDEASLELVEALVINGKRLCVFVASRRPLQFKEGLSLGLASSRLNLRPLAPKHSFGLLEELFSQSNLTFSDVFSENAVRISAGIPLFLHLLFKNYLVTQDPSGLPSTLSDSLMARLGMLDEPAKGVFDTVVTFGALSSVGRIERAVELPRYSLVQGLRALEEQGFLRFADGAVLASHDLLADAARRRMPPSVSQLLHRTAAGILEMEEGAEVDPLEIAIHWRASGENARALQTLINSARKSITLGRPRQAIALINRADGWATCESDRLALNSALVEACHAAGEEHLGFAAAERAYAFSSRTPVEIQIMGIEMAVGAGKVLAPHRKNLEEIAGDHLVNPLLRCRAGRLLIMIADDLGDVGLGRAALALIADTDLSSTEAIIPRLIFEVVFGSIDRATKLAHQLASAARAKEKGARLQPMWTAANALWRCGEREAAIRLGEEGFAVAEANAIWSACTSFSSIVADIAWDAGDLRKCEDWFELSAKMMKKSGGPDRGFQHFGVGISLALYKNDPKRALALLEEAEQLFPGTLQIRLRVNCLAHRVLIKMALGTAPSSREVHDLLEGHIVRRSLGFHDLVAEATIGSLRHLNRLDEANRLREEYLRIYRKERTAVSPLLVHLMGDGVVESHEKLI